MLDNLFTPTHLFILLPYVLIALAIYFLPTLIAVKRTHHNRTPIMLVNIFLGWSAIGWIVTLIWSLTSPVPTQVMVIQQPPASEH
jgi:hypothetical protein